MDPLARFMPRIAWAPDEGGDGAATVKVEINGETREVTKEVADAIVNGAKWEGKLTHRSERLADKEREIAQREAQMAAKETEMNAANRPAPKTAEELLKDAGITLEDVPLPHEDPEGYAAAMQRKLAQVAELGHSTATADVKSQIDALREDVRRTQATSEARRLAFQRNDKTIDAYVARMATEGTPLTTDQKNKLVRYMDTQLRLPEEGFCTRDTASGVTIFTEAALEAADVSIRRNYWTERAKEEGLREGLKRAGLHGEADLSGGRTRPAPKKDATPREKVEFAASLPPQSKALSQYIEGMSSEELNEFLIAQHNLEVEEATVGL